MTVVFLLTIIIFIFIGSITAEIQGCNTTTSDFWPVNCDERGSLIIPDGNNQTSLTTAIYNIVYNTNTSNSSVWTPAGRRQFDSYWNSIRNVIWANNSSISSKINQIIEILMAYSANDCEWQGMFLAETKLEQIGQCIWGTLGDFIVCGNLSSNYSIPTTVAPPNCVGNGTFPPSSTPISETSMSTEPNESSTFPNESTSSTLPSTMPSSVSFETSESSSVSDSTGNVTESMETTIGTSTLEQESTTSSMNLTESSTNPTENQSSSSIPTESSSTDIDQTSTSSNNVMESTSSAETTGSSFGTTQVEESTTTSFEGGTNSTTADQNQNTSESTFGTTTNATETTETASTLTA